MGRKFVLGVEPLCSFFPSAAVEKSRCWVSREDLRVPGYVRASIFTGSACPRTHGFDNSPPFLSATVKGHADSVDMGSSGVAFCAAI